MRGRVKKIEESAKKFVYDSGKLYIILSIDKKEMLKAYMLKAVYSLFRGPHL